MRSAPGTLSSAVGLLGAGQQRQPGKFQANPYPVVTIDLKMAVYLLAQSFDETDSQCAALGGLKPRSKAHAVVYHTKAVAVGRQLVKRSG